jgi:hypothetical protein
MLVVPLKGDTITTKDGPEFSVDSYTNFKPDPAVYVDVPRGQNPIVYFQDIDQINGVKVEYNKSSKVFTALGVVKRKYNLPQPKDIITIDRPGSPDDAGDDDTEVKTPKLHSRSIGLSRGLVLIDTDDNVFSLFDVIDIDRAVGGEHFDRKKFASYYRDYMGRTA